LAAVACARRLLTGNSFLNIITELIAGYAWPGKPIANMMVKCYGYNSVKHGMDFAQDLKLGQYMVGTHAVHQFVNCRLFS